MAGAFSSGGGTVSSISSSLLERIKANDADAWHRLAHLYTPMVYGWARQSELQPADASDLAQEVFQSVATNIASFRREKPSDSFRGWLWTITRNKVRDHFRSLAKQPEATGGSEALRRINEIPESPPDDSTSGQKKPTADLARRALEMMKTDFEEQTWRAFWRTTVEDESPADVATDMGVTVWTVYKARSRVLQRLREEFGDLLD